jgi:hypothetical protein
MVGFVGNIYERSGLFTNNRSAKRAVFAFSAKKLSDVCGFAKNIHHYDNVFAENSGGECGKLAKALRLANFAKNTWLISRKISGKMRIENLITETESEKSVYGK